jgi:hypothetical protein
MTKRSFCILLSATLLLLAAGAVYEAETRVVRGWLGGEAFFQRRPTSNWRLVIINEIDPPPSRLRGTSWWCITDRGDNSAARPLACDLAADDVLQTLAKDDNLKVRVFAKRILLLPRKKELARGNVEAIAAQYASISRDMRDAKGPIHDIE